MVPDPQRVIITRPGMTAHWGVDPSTKRLAIAGQIGSYPQAATHSFPETDGLARLGDIYDGTCEFVRDLLVSWDAPGFVMVEQPSGPRQAVTILTGQGASRRFGRVGDS